MFSARGKYGAAMQRTDSGHDSAQNAKPSRDIRSQEGILAESKGFEPLWRCRLTVFKTAPL